MRKFLTIAVASLIAISCTRQEGIVSSQEESPTEKQYSLDYGKTLFFVNENEMAATKIPTGTVSYPNVQSLTGNFDYSPVRTEDGYALIPSIKTGTSLDEVTYDVVYSDDEEFWSVVVYVPNYEKMRARGVICEKSAATKATGASGNGNDPRAYNTLYSSGVPSSRTIVNRVICQFDPTAPFTHQKGFHLFDPDKVEHFANPSYDPEYSVTSCKGYQESHDSFISSITHGGTLSLQFPIPDVAKGAKSLFGVGKGRYIQFDGHAKVTEKKQNTHEAVYSWATQEARAFCGSIDFGIPPKDTIYYEQYFSKIKNSRLKNIVESLWGPADEELRTSINMSLSMDSLAFIRINHPQTTVDKNYVYQLLDDYGVYFTTQGVIGSQAVNVGFVDKSMCMRGSIVDIELGLSYSGDKTGIDDWWKKGSQTVQKGQVRYNAEETTTKEQANMFFVQWVKGNGFQLVDGVFQPVNQPNYDDAEYLYPKQGGSADQIHCIYELCLNPEVRELMKIALTPDGKGEIPYFKDRKFYCERESPIVLADIKVIHRDDHHSPEAEDAKPMYMMSNEPTPKLRLYYPMYKNPNMWGNKTAAVTDFALWEWADAKRVSDGYTIVYYALDYADNCDGIVGIKYFPHGEEVSGEWTKTGVNMDRGVKRIKGGFLCVQFTPPNNKKIKAKDKIKALGFKFTDWDKDAGQYKGQIFTSTGGAEWRYNVLNGFENKTVQDEFNAYWGSDFIPGDLDGVDAINQYDDYHRKYTYTFITSKKDLRKMDLYSMDSRYSPFDQAKGQ